MNNNTNNKVTPDMIIADVLNLDKGTAPVFYGNGLFCLGCPSASGESIKEACEIHGIDCDNLLQELNDYLASK